jgi:5'-nucleotidase
MRILVTNDDGIHAPGIKALVLALAKWQETNASSNHEIIVIAPDDNHSGAGAAVGEVFSRDGVKIERFALEGAEHIEAYGLDASPALCTIIGCRGAFGPRPDLIVSGINEGVNVGNSILHSGTIGAALTGSLIGISGLAVSLQTRPGATFDVAATLAAGLIDELTLAGAGTVLSLNVPGCSLAELKGIRYGRVARAGIIKEHHEGTANPHADMIPGQQRKIELKLGAAVPSLGDVTGEVDSIDDGALIAGGYATLTALRTVGEDITQESAEVVERALASLQHHVTR